MVQATGPIDGSFRGRKFKAIQFNTNIDVGEITDNGTDSTINSNTTVGRRGVVHHYPFKDTPFFEDLGRMARQFQLKLAFIGDDHLSESNTFINIVEQEGSGILVHPYHGQFEVVPITVNVSNDISKIGETIVDVEFIELGRYDNPDSLFAGRRVTPVSSSELLASFDLNELEVDGTIFSLRDAGLSNDELADVVDDYYDNVSIPELIDIVNSGGQSGSQDFDGGGPLSDQENYLIALLKLSESLSNPSNFGNIDDFLNIRNTVLANVDSSLLTIGQTDPVLASNLNFIGLTALRNFDAQIGGVSAIALRSYASNLPSVIISQTSNTLHDAITSFNDFIDPFFMNTQITIANPSNINSDFSAGRFNSVPTRRRNDNFIPSYYNDATNSFDFNNVPTNGVNGLFL